MAKEDISLLPKHGLEGTFIGRIFDWVFSVGRYILVFTELIVIGAFLSRFWLDRKITDLSAKIRQQRAILESTREFEDEFRLFQSKLDVIAQELEDETDVLLPFQIVVGALPDNIYLRNFSWSDESRQVNLNTAVFSEAALSLFIENLLSQSEVESVNIGTIEKAGRSQGIEIKISVSFNEKINNGS